MAPIPELRAWARHCLLEADPVTKTDEVARMAAAYAAGACTLDAAAALADSPAIPGRPARPVLVAPKEVGRRSMATP